MSWQRRLMLGLVIFMAAVWGGDRLQQRHDRSSLTAQMAASEEGRRLAVEIDSAVDRLKEYQRAVGNKQTSEQVAEENRLLAEVNRLNAAQVAVLAKINGLQQPWPYRTAWNVTAYAWLALAVGRSVHGTMQERRAAVRRESGRCVACGYDLRATPDRCPECGTLRATA